MEDLGIKLFGKKIVLPEISKSFNPPVISTAAGKEPSGGDGDNKHGGSDHTRDQNSLEGERVIKEAAEKDQLKSRSSPKAMAESENPKTPSIDEESRTEESERVSTNPQPKTLKKPDKILPCPRCTSMDTKFCYYNNYNVNQPRHFCKSCQRYWTAGGAMRNMPVGAGRRKNKNPGSHCRYITISQESFQAAASSQLEVTSTSNVTTSDSINTQSNKKFNSEIPKIHSIPGVSWPYNPWNPTIPIPIPAVCPPLPIYPSTYWNCLPLVPPILGKHSRDEVLVKASDCEDELKKPKNSVLIPKTLRIDDPDEAAKSSIWATLGIKNENFKAFQEKGEEKKHQATTVSPALHANPAAFSRSLCFQETA